MSDPIHPSEIQVEPMTTMEQWLRQGPWGYSMVTDAYVVCPGCGTPVYDHKTGQHAEKCDALRRLAGGGR